MIGSETRQARKGATVVTDSCAGVWLSGLPLFLFQYTLLAITWLVYASFLIREVRYVLPGTGAQVAPQEFPGDGRSGACP